MNNIDTNQITSTIRKFRPDIEGLRAIAVICVVLAHSGIGLKGGFIGVDIFFVISGYLITRHIFLESIKTNTVSLAHFYARRILRILPASIFVLLCTLLASWIWLSPLQFVDYSWDALSSTLSVFNYRLAINGTDYFNTSTIPTPFQHYWSLCVEEQFYFIWPLIMLVLAKLFSKKSYFGNVVSAVLIVVIAISLYLSYTITTSSQPWAYFGLHTRAWQMAIGALLAVNINKFVNISPKIGSILSWVGFGSLVYALATFTESMPYPSFWAVIPTLATALIVASGVNLNPYSFEYIFGKNIFQFVGKVSYSWYLVHWPLFVIFLLAGERNDLKDQVGIVIVSFVLAIVSYCLIENPIRHNQSVKFSLVKTYLLGLALILIASSLSVGAIYLKNQSIKNAITKSNIQNNLKNNLTQTTDATESAIIQKVKEGLEIKTLPDNLVMPLDKFIDDKPKFGCIENKLDLIPVFNDPKCTIGDTKSNKTMVLIGDSHSYHWVGAINKIAKNNNYKLVIYTKSGCPMQNITHYDNSLKRDYTECYSWRDEAMLQIEKIKPDIIINSGVIYLNSTPTAYTDYINKLKSISGQVITILDTPRPMDNVQIPECLSKNSTDIQKCSLTLPKAIIAKTKYDEQTKILKQLEVKTIDMLDFFCYNTKCPVIIDNIVVYHDNSHISDTYAKFLINVLEKRIFSTSPNNNSNSDSNSDSNNITEAINKALSLTKLPTNLVVPLEKVSKDYDFTCKDDYDVSAPTEKNKCILGNKNGDKNSAQTIALIGDSHAQQWTSTLDTIAKKYGYKIITFTKASCTFIDAKFVEPFLKREYTECYDWKKAVFSELKALQPDLILLSQKNRLEATSENYTQMLQNLQSISDKPTKLAIIQDTPKATEKSAECLVKNPNNIAKCNYTRAGSLLDQKQSTTELEINKKMNVPTVMVYDWFCGEVNCPVIIDNIVVFMDEQHTTKSYTKYLTPLMEEQLITKKIL